MPKPLKNVLITGSSSGIGLEISNVLKNNYNLFLQGKRELNLNNYCSIDLTNVNKIPDLVEKAYQYFNSEIDILINCAGAYIYKPIEQMTIDEINYLIDLNFKSAYFLSSLIVPMMKKNKWGRIINIGSISATVGEGNATLYCATKGALCSFTKALALETAQDNITVNQINPGWVDTPLAQEALSDEDIQEVIDVTPQKRFITPKEVAKLCEYLISDDAKGLTGQNINLCAGLSIGC